MEIVIDGHLLEEAERGNREAIAQFAEIAVEHLQAMAARSITGLDDLTPFLSRLLQAIADGRSPNEAFRWERKGRQPQNDTFFKWCLARWVKDLIGRGMSRSEAFEIVGDAASKDGGKGGLVEKAFDQFKDCPLPDDIFPIPQEDERRLQAIEKKLAKYRKN